MPLTHQDMCTPIHIHTHTSRHTHTLTTRSMSECAQSCGHPHRSDGRVRLLGWARARCVRHQRCVVWCCCRSACVYSAVGEMCERSGGLAAQLMLRSLGDRFCPLLLVLCLLLHAHAAAAGLPCVVCGWVCVCFVCVFQWELTTLR